MTPERAQEFYDRQYTQYREGGQLACPYSLNDLAKAQRRTNAILRTLRLEEEIKGARVLDVGCGLGYYTKALALAGADATGLDISRPGIDVATAKWPGIDFRCGAWPKALGCNEKFDVIWTVALSVINVLEADTIRKQLVEESIPHLNPGGHLIMGWASNFRGAIFHNWSDWSFGMIKQMRQDCGLSRPIVPMAPARLNSWAMMRMGHLLKKRVPFFMYLNTDQCGVRRSGYA